MPLKVDKLIATEIVADGYDIKSPSKDPREYALGKGKYVDVFGEDGIFGNSNDAGEYILNNDYFNFPENSFYVLASVETFLKFEEAQVDWDQSVLTNEKLNIAASVETYLKFWEANYIQPAGYNIEFNYTNKTGFQSEFLKLINDDTYFTNINNKGQLFDILIDKGIVEFGQIGEGSKLVYTEILKKMILSIEFIANICNNPDFPNIDNTDNNYVIVNLLYHYIDRGIVVREFKGNLIIGNVEQYLKFGEREAENFQCVF
jgi:hypothetical protein